MTSFRHSDADPIARGLDGKVVVLTEAGSGPGAAAAPLLAAAGAQLVLGARRLDAVEGLARALAARGHAVRTLALDAGDPRDMQRFISLAHAWQGRLDVIVNSAGLQERAAALCLDDLALRAALHGIKAGLPLLRARGTGQIVNLVPPGRGAAQQALRALTEGLRQELGALSRVSLLALRADATGRAMVRAISEAVSRSPSFDKTLAGFVETMSGACGAAHRFPSSSSGLRAFFGENGARPRSSGANLN